MPVPYRFEHGKRVQKLPRRPWIPEISNPRQSAFPFQIPSDQMYAMGWAGSNDGLDVVSFNNIQQKIDRGFYPKYPWIRHEKICPQPYGQSVDQAFLFVFQNYPWIFYRCPFYFSKDAVRLPNGEF